MIKNNDLPIYIPKVVREYIQENLDFDEKAKIERGVEGSNFLSRISEDQPELRQLFALLRQEFNHDLKVLYFNLMRLRVRPAGTR